MKVFEGIVAKFHRITSGCFVQSFFWNSFCLGIPASTFVNALLVCRTPWFYRNDTDDFDAIINHIEQPEVTYTISPSFRLPVGQLFYVLPKVRILPQLSVYHSYNLLVPACALANSELPEVFQILVSLKDLKLARQIGL